MPDTWDSLTQYEQNALVATDAMGWHESHGPSGEPEWRYKSVARACSVKDYRPTVNIEQAYEVIRRIVAIGLTERWTRELAQLLKLTIANEVTWATIFIAATAPPDAICHAAVLAVGGMNDA